MNKDNTEKIVAFMEQTEKMGKQLRATFEHQRLILNRMLDLSKANKHSPAEYVQLETESIHLKNIIDKWQPIYNERIAMIKSAMKKK